jgi:hypothetical protein
LKEVVEVRGASLEEEMNLDRWNWGRSIVEQVQVSCDEAVVGVLAI